MKILVDFDSFIYSSGFSAQETVYFVCDKDEEMPEQYNYGSFPYKAEAEQFMSSLPPGEDLQVVKSVHVKPVSHAINALKLSLSALKKELGDRHNTYELFLTDGASNFRIKLATIQPYKGNRNEDDKPAHYDALRSYAIAVLGAQLIKGQEADDEVAIRQSQSSNSMIVSIDKDLNQVPGWHYNPRKKVKYFVTEIEGLRSFYMQMLTGDISDNIPGLFKLTGVKATQKIKQGLEDLTTNEEMWDYVYKMYECEDSSLANVEEVLTEIGQLLWMRRAYGQMWQPPKDIL